jgi:hypothetical protein
VKTISAHTKSTDLVSQFFTKNIHLQTQSL